MTDCVFCKIITGNAPAKVIEEDEDFIVITSIYPLAPIHLLIIPRRHVTSMNELEEDDLLLAGKLLMAARRVAQKVTGKNGGYRLVINTGAQGGQTVFHLHLHILAGKFMGTDLITSGLL